MSESVQPPPLSLLESRVLGVLVEKERTVPDTYPLTLNALLAGCNQKTSRNPVLDVGERELVEALDALRRHALIIESSGGRTMRYAHNVKRVFGLPSQSVALLAMLALRGPQTAAELRAHCDRLERFADLSSVEGFLDELAARPQGALVALLPRQPGAREARWMHRLGGEPAPDTIADAGPAMTAARAGGANPAATLDLVERLLALEGRVAALEAELAGLRNVSGAADGRPEH